VSKLLNDVIICVTIGLSLILALFFSVSLVERHLDYPPTLISVFLGLSVAALTYRFLGGVDGTEFRVGVLKLGGSAALLIGTTWFLSERIKDELNILTSSAGYRTRIAQLATEVADRGKEVAARDQTIRQLRVTIEQMPDQAAAASIEQIRKMTPDDPRIKAIRQMVASHEPPFGETIRDMTARVAMVPMPNDGAFYNICPATYAALYKDVDPNSKILVSRSIGADGDNVSIILERNGRIGNDVCEKPSRDFEMQIGCATALKLFPDIMTSCGDGAKIRGQSLTVGALP
jgi:hypothetical protein